MGGERASSSAVRVARRLAALVLCAWLTGCATTHPGDPFEPMNRKVYAFNEALDKAVVKPVAQTYRDVVPRPVRTGVSNFFSNIGDAWSAINSLLQLKLEPALRNTMRFGINTVFGWGGLLDIATEARIERQEEDFGQTLGRWGVGPGPYIVLPLLGPSTLRDTAALPLDMRASAAGLVGDEEAAVGLTALRMVERRAALLDATRLLEQVALDPYLFVRDAYLQRRRNAVYDGNPPAEDDEYDEEYDEQEQGQPPGKEQGAAQ
ncbi:MlaA family lipoprotein [Caldimonas aquatica]|uniref:VacJ family lipoprotein n=1 Tax=Caldimonas aquatica TaxID=376175 RepID=A0ABY6MPA6_9BURK|nr:VacJ family lipoprotein [Schlegelella aquatica]UZD54299.1 VacJ family lipoprotein [Schlegelella aquatica]